MGYSIEAVVGPLALLTIHSADFPSAFVAPLALGFALIPITNDLLDEIGASGASGDFYKFTPALAGWLRTVSASIPVAYIEADYFGGIGNQGATVFSHGQQLLAPTHGTNSINTALRLLGVSRGTFRDEFEAVGLPRHRHMDDWLENTILKKPIA